MKITLNHSRLGTSLLSVLPTKRSWNSLCPFYLKATSLRLRIALGVFLFYICSGAIVTAQVRFVQLTDPHLFDQSEREQNKQIFIDAIWEINKLQAKNGAYDFVVVTGDIGVESIINNEGEGAIDKNAKMIADKMSLSEVKLWLFVPGNNDLVDELPHTIKYYQRFIERLGFWLEPHGIKVTDLSSNEPGTLPFTLHDKYLFIGFNNAAFKNNNDIFRLTDGFSTKSTSDDCESQKKEVESCLNDKETKDKPKNCSSATMIRCFQSQELKRISGLIDSAKERKQFAYIFYHIPDVDDPYLTSDRGDWKLHDFRRIRDAAKEITKSDYVNSSWFVDQVLREEWESIIKVDNVKGLFAGHLHDNHPETYQKYPNAAHAKLFICPPLAIKLQSDQHPQARGFCDVSINNQGDVVHALGPDGSVTNGIYWYDDKNFTFATQPPVKGGYMSWEKWAHISTVLQFLLLAVSVYFVWKQLKKQAEQLKQQTDLARVANTQALVGLASPFNLEVSQNKDVAGLWLNGPNQGDKLSAVEKEQYESLLRWWFIFYENVFFQGNHKLLDEAIYKSWLSDLNWFIDYHLVEKHWSGLNDQYHREFVEYVNSRIEAKKKSANGA